MGTAPSHSGSGTGGAEPTAHPIAVLVPAAQEENEKDDKKEEEHTCMACQTKLKTDHTGIVCMQNHHICGPQGCANNFVEYVLSEGILRIPVQCMLCHVDVIPNTFERNCTQIQLKRYSEMCVKVGAESTGEKLYSCKFCSLQVILIKSDGDLLFECPNPACRTTYCMVCNEACKSASEREPHVIECPALGALKDEVERVIADGGAQSCPGCGHTGRKDENCTHITCPSCHTRWCYVCGLERTRAHGGEALHNSNWESDARRCPMFLQNIHRSNPEWPAGARDAVDYFHRRQILWKLREKLLDAGEADCPIMPRVWGVLWRQRVQEAVKLERGSAIMRRLLEKFPQVADGFTLDEIVSAGSPRNY